MLMAEASRAPSSFLGLWHCRTPQNTWALRAEPGFQPARTSLVMWLEMTQSWVLVNPSVKRTVATSWKVTVVTVGSTSTSLGGLQQSKLWPLRGSWPCLLGQAIVRSPLGPSRELPRIFLESLASGQPSSQAPRGRHHPQPLLCCELALCQTKFSCELL